MRAEGIVYKIFDNETRVGTTYQIKIDGDDKYYGTYKTRPDTKPGDFVKFEFTTKGRFHNVKMDTLEIEACEVETSAGAAEGAPSEGATKARASNDGRQMSIVWQHSQEMALRLAQVAQDAGCLDLGAKKGGQFEALQVWVNASTEEFYGDAMTAATGVHPFEQV